MTTLDKILLVVLIILAALLLSTPSTMADDDPKDTEIKLKDGKVLRGVLRQIRPSFYLVQTDDELIELSAEEIELVNGQQGIPSVGNERPLATSMHRAQLQPDGSLDLWTFEEITNTHDEILTYAMFGAKERELPTMKTMQAYDQFGNRLNVRIEPRAGTGLYNVFIDFEVPILPGESMRGSLRYVYQNQIECDGQRCRNQFWGDFPEDRLHTRRVELPKGAKLLKVDPEPNLQYEHDGKTVVVWRRYYPAKTGFPLVVEYELKH